MTDDKVQMSNEAQNPNGQNMPWYVSVIRVRTVTVT